MSDPDELGQVVQQAYSAGYERHGDLGLDADTFAQRFLWLTGKNSDIETAGPSEALRILCAHAPDVYLALACIRNDAVAWNRLTKLYWRPVFLEAFRVCRNRWGAREVASTVFGNLFLPNRSGRRRIESYKGRSSLVTWLRAIARNTARNEMRDHRSNAGESVGAEGAREQESTQDCSNLADIESTIRVSRYAGIISSALEYACQSLSEEERILLLLRYEKGLRLSRLAAMLGVHVSTSARRIQKAERKLAQSVRDCLQTKEGLNPPEVAVCISDIVGNKRYSVLETLGRLCTGQRAQGSNAGEIRQGADACANLAESRVYTG